MTKAVINLRLWLFGDILSPSEKLSSAKVKVQPMRKWKLKIFEAADFENQEIRTGGTYPYPNSASMELAIANDNYLLSFQLLSHMCGCTEQWRDLLQNFDRTVVIIWDESLGVFAHLGKDEGVNPSSLLPYVCSEETDYVIHYSSFQPCVG